MTDRTPAAGRVHGTLLLVSLLFGVHYVGTKEVVDAVDPRAWAFIRMAAATAVLVPVAMLWRRRGHPWPPRRLLAPLALAALLGFAANQLIFAEGLSRTTPAHAAILHVAIPILVLLFAVLARQERATRPRLVAMGIALTGVLVLLRVESLFDGPGLDATLAGDLLVLTNITCFSVYLVYMRRLGGLVDPLMATATCFVLATAMMAPWCVGALDAAAFEALAGPGVWPWALYVVLGPTVLTYILNNWALRHTDSSQVALYIYVQPLVATALSIGLGHDEPGWRFWLAGALVSLGLLIEIRAGRPAGRLRGATGPVQASSGSPSGTTTSSPT